MVQTSSCRRAPSRKQAWLCSWVILYWNSRKVFIHTWISYIIHWQYPCWFLVLPGCSIQLKQRMFQWKFVISWIFYGRDCPECPNTFLQASTPSTPCHTERAQRNYRGLMVASIAASLADILLWKTMLMFPLIFVGCFFPFTNDVPGIIRSFVPYHQSCGQTHDMYNKHIIHLYIYIYIHTDTCIDIYIMLPYLEISHNMAVLHLPARFSWLRKKAGRTLSAGGLGAPSVAKTPREKGQAVVPRRESIISGVR